MKKQSKSLKWYYKNRNEQITKNRKWKEDNRERMLKQKKEYHEKNRDEILKRKKEYRLKNKEKIKLYRQKEDVKLKAREHMKLKRKLTKRKYDKEYYQNNKDIIALKQKVHSQIPEVKERRRLMERLRNKANPRSNRSDPLELQYAKNRVRIRDQNKCQWKGCIISYKQGRIDVHHIFPKSEHPELELEERYMICYCETHHAYWHMMRGDKYYKMISPQNYNLDITVRGRD